MVLILASSTWAEPQADPRTANPPKAKLGSIARQLDLKMRTARTLHGTLTAAIEHNRQTWESLLPDQRDAYRRQVLAFLEKNPMEQEQLLAHYEKLMQLSAEKREKYRERAKWLTTVLATFSPAQREDLKKASPQDRAREILARRDELMRQGKLQARQPTTATAPAAD